MASAILFDTFKGIDSLSVELIVQDRGMDAADAATIDSVWWVHRPTVDIGILAFVLQP